MFKYSPLLLALLIMPSFAMAKDATNNKTTVSKKIISTKAKEETKVKEEIKAPEVNNKLMLLNNIYYGMSFDELKTLYPNATYQSSRQGRNIYSISSEKIADIDFDVSAVTDAASNKVIIVDYASKDNNWSGDLNKDLEKVNNFQNDIRQKSNMTPICGEDKSAHIFIRQCSFDDSTKAMAYTYLRTKSIFQSKSKQVLTFGVSKSDLNNTAY